MLIATTCAPGRAQARAAPAPTLPKPSIAIVAPSSLRPRWSERGLGCSLDAVPGGEVVHAEPFVALRPKGQALEVGVTKSDGRVPMSGPVRKTVSERASAPAGSREDGARSPPAKRIPAFAPA